jgi:hypothetical protein
LPWPGAAARSKSRPSAGTGGQAGARATSRTQTR